MKPPFPENANDGPAEGATLAFDWKRGGRWSFRVPVLVFVSLFAHALCFYVFQVVYPASERFDPAPARITLLSPGDPRSREMLRAIEDRVVYLDASTRETVRETPMESYSVAFRPSFADFELELKTAPGAAVESPAADPFEFESAVLPEVAPAEPRDDPAAARRAPGSGEFQVIPGDTLRDRAIVARGDWTWADARRAELEGQRVVLTVCVTPQGRLQHVLVNSGIESSLDAKIVAAARGILFAPADGGEPLWGTLRIQW